jgi:hypothetical protein
VEQESKRLPFEELVAGLREAAEPIDWGRHDRYLPQEVVDLLTQAADDLEWYNKQYWHDHNQDWTKE